MSEYRESFVQTLRISSEMRHRVFDLLEQRHAKDFENGPAGVRYYENMLAAVRDADVPAAAEEFQKRFAPLLDPDGSRQAARAAREAALLAKAAAGESGEASGRAHTWQWLLVLTGAAVLAVLVAWLLVPPPPPPEPVPATPAPAAPAPAPPQAVTPLPPNQPDAPTEEPPTQTMATDPPATTTAPAQTPAPTEAPPRAAEPARE